MIFKSKKRTYTWVTNCKFWREKLHPV